MLFADVVGACHRVVESGERDDQVEMLREMLAAAPLDDVGAVVAFATGSGRPDTRSEVWRVPADAAVGRPPDEPSLTVRAVDRTFRRLGSLKGAGAEAARERVLIELFRRATTAERSFIGRFIRGADTTTVPDAVMTTAIARTADTRVREVQRAAMLTGSLSIAAQIAVRDGAGGLAEVGIAPLHPVDPMLAIRTDDLTEALDSVPQAGVEPNLVGARLQAHRYGANVRLFLGNRYEVTDRLPTVVDVVRSCGGGDLVLDGVLVGFDGEGWPIEELSTLIEHMSLGAKVGLLPLFFDVLFVDTTVVDEPLSRRRELLEEVVAEEYRTMLTLATDRSDADDLLDVAEGDGHDGIVVKDLAAPYVPGRRGRAWRLVRSVSTLDLVVLAAEWGSGRRRGRLSTLHLGARSADGEFVMVGKTSSGLTDDMLEWQTNRLQELRIADASDDQIVTVRPEQVVRVAIEGVNATDRYEGGLSLQSARLRHYHTDMPAAAADTVEAVRDFLEPDEPSGPLLPLERMIDPDQTGMERPNVILPQRSLEAEAATRAALVEQVPPRLAEIGVVGTTSLTKIDFDFPPYEAPSLSPLRHMSIGVVITRLMAFAWVAVIAIAALQLRTQAEFVPADADRVRNIGRFGLLVVVAVAVAGWWWSDRRTRNLQLLDGRRPSRLRCLTAWLSPLVVSVLLAVTILQLEPGELFDVRPPIVAFVFALALWRPYSLLRRILATLIRLRFDSLLGAAYVLDLVAFGLIWWRLHVWPDGDTLVRGEVDTLAGVSLAVTITMLISIFAWWLIVRAGAYAEAHRSASQRTRYEHRMLRLRNVDPTDPEVWWALVQRRADEQREAERALRLEKQGETPKPDAPEPVVIPSGEMFVESVRRNHRVALKRLGDQESEALLEGLRNKFSTALADVDTDELTGAFTAAPLTSRSNRTGQRLQPSEGDGGETDELDLRSSILARFGDAPSDASGPGVGLRSALEARLGEADRPASGAGAGEDPLGLRSALRARFEPPVAPAPDAEGPAGATPVPDTEPDPEADDELDEEVDEGAGLESDVDPDSDPVPGIESPVPDEPVPPPFTLGLRPQRDQPPTSMLGLGFRESDKPVFGERQADGDDQTADDDDDAIAGDPLLSLRERLGVVARFDEASEINPIEQLLDQAGLVHIEAALADRRRRDAETGDAPRMVPPKLYALEAARGVLLVAFAATVATAVWLASRAVGAATVADLNLLVQDDVVQIERARRGVFDAFSLAVVLAPLWSYAIAAHARKCGAPKTPINRTLACFVAAVGFSGAAFVIDGDVRGTATLLLLVPAASLATIAVLSLEPIVAFFDLRSPTHFIWPVGIPVVLAIIGLGRLHQPIAPTDSLQALTFFTVLVSLLVALVVTIAAASTIDLEDAVRLSPELAVPATPANDRIGGRFRRRRHRLQ